MSACLDDPDVAGARRGAPRGRLPSRPTTFQPEPSWKALGPSLWFDPEGKQLILRARVALREGPLEHLLCLKGTKEHEASSRPPPRPVRSTPACS